MTFVFLPEDGASANDELERFHEEFLAAGPVEWTGPRAADFRELLESTWLPPVPWKQGGTTCALYQGTAMQAAGLQARRKVNPQYAITTWLKCRGFVGPEWIPVEDLKAAGGAIRGDLPYFCGGGPSTWKAATNGHVACVTTGSGLDWILAQGGGANGRCKIGDAPVSILSHSGRPLRGVWRPNHFASVIRGHVGEDIHDTQPDGFVELRRGMRGPRVGEWQNHLLRLHFELPKYGADSDFGGETEAATRAFQIKNTIPNTGIVDRRTFETAKAM